MESTLYNGYSTLYQTLRQALEWLAPPRCLSCQRPVNNRQSSHRHIPCCNDCYPSLPFQHHYCIQCGQAFTGPEEHCGHCLVSPPHYDLCFCPFEYEEPISNTIIRLKYHERPELAAPLAMLFCHEIEQQRVLLPELLIPVPMHVSRLRQRGFNQSTLLAKAIGRSLDIPVATNLIAKAIKTEAQAKQSLTQRQINLRGSFAMKKNCCAQSVAIIDDVVTTGATVGEIAKILKKNGVDCVQVWGLSHSL